MVPASSSERARPRQADSQAEIMRQKQAAAEAKKASAACVLRASLWQSGRTLSRSFPETFRGGRCRFSARVWGEAVCDSVSRLFLDGGNLAQPRDSLRETWQLEALDFERSMGSRLCSIIQLDSLTQPSIEYRV